MLVNMSYMRVARYENINIKVLSPALEINNPDTIPTRPIDIEVAIVQGPNPMYISLITIDKNPTINPVKGPNNKPDNIVRGVVRETFGINVMNILVATDNEVNIDTTEIFSVYLRGDILIYRMKYPIYKALSINI